jgi:hypothetical protein
MCIKQWELVEIHLFKICELILGANRKHLAIIYYRTPTLDSRLSLTNDLVESMFPKRPGEHDHPDLVCLEITSWRDTLAAAN